MKPIMKRMCVVVLVVSGILSMTAGCGRKSPQNESQQSTHGTNGTRASGNSASVGTNESVPESNSMTLSHSNSGMRSESFATNLFVVPDAGPPRTKPSEMILIPSGHFIMGDKEQDDAPPHEVIIGAFYLDKYLVTQDKYQKVMGSNPSRWKGDKNPVEQVRWSDAVKYCNKLSAIEGLQPCYDLTNWQCNFEADGYRLPTEAEWEYACRAGTTTAYFFGPSSGKLGGYAWYEKNSGGRPHPVGQKEPNPWGLYDMCGNVWQWCNDFYKVDYYKESLQENPKGPPKGETKSVRGGAFRFSDETCRSGYRYNENPGYADVCFGYDIYGFRCARRAANKGK